MNPIRARIGQALDGSGAFLRRDRGAGLYVTDLPAKQGDCAAFIGAMEEAGIRVERDGLLLRLVPDTRWAAAFVDWAEARIEPGALTRQLEKTRGRPVCPEETACWLEGMKRIELGDAGDYERVLRQTAAAALRKKGGGLLYACGLCLDMMEAKKRPEPR